MDKAKESRSISGPNDSFAGLADLMRSKEPWITAQNSQLQRLVPVPGPRIKSHVCSSPKLQVLHIEDLDIETTPITQSPTSTCETAHKTAMDTPAMNTDSSDASSHDHDCHEAHWKHMEEMIEDMHIKPMDSEGPPESNIVPTGLDSLRHSQQVEPPLYTLAESDSPDSSYKDMFRPSPPQDREPLVRLPQGIWNDMIEQTVTLQKEKLEALTRLSTMERNEHLSRQTLSDCSTKLDQLQYRVEMNEQYKATMSRDIRQKDAMICQYELENQALKDQVVQFAAMQRQLEKLGAENDFLRTEALKATEATEQSGADIKCFIQPVESRDREISHLKDEIKRLEDNITRINSQNSSHQARADNLAETQTVREKKLKQAEQQLAAVHDSKEKLLDDLDHARTENKPLKLRIKELETQLREKTSSCDRMRNDLRHTEKRLEITSRSLNKVENHDALKGAAHAIVPSESTKLPKLVLPCIECFAKNITCDAKSRCQNCLNHGEKCLRWKCSQMHILRGGCQEYLCMLHHDHNGWLMLRHEQPQW